MPSCVGGIFFLLHQQTFIPDCTMLKYAYSELLEGQTLKSWTRLLKYCWVGFPSCLLWFASIPAVELAGSPTFTSVFFWTWHHKFRIAVATCKLSIQLMVHWHFIMQWGGLIRLPWSLRSYRQLMACEEGSNHILKYHDHWWVSLFKVSTYSCIQSYINKVGYK